MGYTVSANGRKIGKVFERDGKIWAQAFDGLWKVVFACSSLDDGLQSLVNIHRLPRR